MRGGFLALKTKSKKVFFDVIYLLSGKFQMLFESPLRICVIYLIRVIVFAVFFAYFSSFPLHTHRGQAQQRAWQFANYA